MSGFLSREALLEAAVALQRDGRFAEAAERCRMLLVREPADPNALHLLGLARGRAGEAAAGLVALQRALAVAPGMSAVRQNLASLLADQNRAREAAGHWEILAWLEPASAPLWTALGRVLLNAGSAMLPRAETVLRRAVALDPRLAEALDTLGKVQRQLLDLTGAVDSHRRALAADPAFLTAYLGLANALMDQGDEAAVMRCAAAALVLAPDVGAFWFTLGNAQTGLGAFEAALASFRRAERLGIGQARPRISAVLTHMERWQEAERSLLASLAHPHDAALAVEMLTDLWKLSGALDHGRAVLEAVAKVPAAAHAAEHVRLGLAALELASGRPDVADALTRGLDGDSGWLFTVQSLAALHRTPAARRRRPDPVAPGVPRITSSTLCTRGRFAHNVLEYVLLRLYAEKHGLVLETPDWVGDVFFELDDPPPATPLPPLLFGRHRLNRWITGHSDEPPAAGRDFVSPLFLLEYREAYRARVQTWLRPRAVWRPYLEPAMERLRQRGGTVVAIHIRRGDFVTFGYPMTETEWYVDWLRRLWPGLDRPVLYLASDDLAKVRAAFAEFDPVTVADVAPPWPGLEYLQDFHVLSQADVVGISAASGFSQLAARLNSRARLFGEPDLVARAIRPFVPWV